jgi:hypothetical protein
MSDGINYSLPLSYQNIEDAMRHAIKQMNDLTKDFAVTADEYGSTEATFKVAFAKSRLMARVSNDYEGKKMTADLAEDIATVDTESERMAMEASKAKHDAARQALMSVRSRLEALRSLMASYRDIGA